MKQKLSNILLATFGTASMIIWLAVIVVTLVSCKPPVQEVLDKPAAQTVQVEDVGSVNPAAMTTRYHTMNIKWRVAKTENNPHGIVVIESAYFEGSGVDKNKCLLDDYLTNYFKCYSYTGDKREAMKLLSTAQAAVIVSYTLKQQDVTEYTIDVETKAQSFYGREKGVQLSKEIDFSGWK